MEQWEKNLKILATKNKKLAEVIRQIIEEEQDTNVLTQEVENGNRILGICHNGRIWYLNSRLDPEGAAGLFADRYEIKPFYRYFVFGFSDGRAVRKLLEKCDETNVIVICEPNQEVFAEAIKQYDLEDIFSDKRVLPCVLEFWKEITKIVFLTIEFSYLKLIEFCILPGYDILYTEECQKFMDEVLNRIKAELLEQGTYMHFGRRVPRNMLFNMKNMIQQRNVAQLKQEMKKLDIQNVPAIVISAGPSLDKNIKEIKKAEGKAFIFVVDAALRTVIREGIRPNVVCSIDGKSPERFFENVGNEEFNWVCAKTTNPVILKKHGNRVFYENAFTPWWNGIVEGELGYKFPEIKSGGSVSTEAFELARYLGFQTIILIGQDLAFTGGQSHTSGIKGVLGENDEYIKKRHIVQVEDAQGNPLDTDFQMNEYRLWFEKAIEEAPDSLRVIDATEGGAKIRGTIIQPLKETIEQECQVEIDFYELVNNIPSAFNQEQQTRLYQRLKELEDIKEDFRIFIERGISQEEALLDRIKKETLTVRTISAELEKMMAYNTELENHRFTDYLVLYTKKAEYEMKENICAKEDMSAEEVIEQNLKLLRAYQEAIPLFEEDYKEMVNL